MGLLVQTLILLLGTSCSKDPQTIEDRFKMTVRARALLEDGEAHDAAELLEKVLRGAKTAEALHNYALVQWQKGERRAAGLTWERALEIDPTEIRALFGLARWHRLEEARLMKSKVAEDLETGAAAADHSRRALELLEQASSLDGRNAAIHRALHEVYLSHADTTAARKSLAEAERLDPIQGGRLPRLFGLTRIALPTLRRPTSVTRIPPQFVATTTRFKASGLQVISQQPAASPTLACLGTPNILRYPEGISDRGVDVEKGIAEATTPWQLDELDIDTNSIVLIRPFFDDSKSGSAWLMVTRSREPSKADWNQVFLLKAEGDSYSTQRLQEVHYTIYDLDLLDYDADGDLDVVVASSRRPGLRIWKNNGPAGFDFDFNAFANAFAEKSAVRQVVCADLNSDSKRDIVYTLEDGRLRVLLNRGASDFVPAQQLGDLANAKARAVDCIDLDENGSMDIVLGNDQGLWIYSNLGAARFERRAAYRETRAAWTGAPHRGPGVADFTLKDMDNDGRVDVISLHFENPVVAVRKDSKKHEDSAPPVPTSTVTGSLPKTMRLAFWRNEGEGILTEVGAKAHLDMHHFSSALPAIADFDADGDLDLACVGADQQIFMLWNRVESTYRRQRFELQSNIHASLGFGARVELYAGARRYHIIASRPHCSIGIGFLTHADLVRVIWADGKQQNFFDVDLNPARSLLVDRSQSNRSSGL